MLLMEMTRHQQMILEITMEQFTETVLMVKELWDIQDRFDISKIRSLVKVHGHVKVVGLRGKLDD